MKVLFAGPSIYGLELDLAAIELRHPAKQGDVIAAVRDGATAIGLIDGYFGGAAAVWHKEILYALSLGVRVMGSSSMGALRAAECAAYGMEPIGEIAEAYASGRLDDDAAVALVHAPPEFGSQPMSEPLVDALATLSEIERLGLVTTGEGDALRRTAEACFFGDRTAETIAGGAGLPSDRAAEVGRLYRLHHVSLKQRDALLLIERLRAAPDEREPMKRTWSFAVTPLWRQLFDTVNEPVTQA
jgi:hypothetical protein